MVEPEDTPKETEEAAEPSPARKGRQSFSKLRRELSEDELSSPAVQRMLIDEIERLERENSQLSSYRHRFYSADQRAAILEERSRRSVAGEIMFGFCLTVGAAAMGYAPSVWSQQPSGWLSLIFGVTLVIGGIVSRVVQR